MTIDDLRNLPRTSTNGCTSLLGVFIDANTNGNEDLARMACSVMAEQNTAAGLGTRDDRGVPMVGDVTPGHSRELLRRIELRERSNG